MSNSIKISNLFILVLFILSCSNDDSTEGVSIENQPPTAFTINIAIDKNTAQLNWTNAQDPEDDSIEYTVLLENTPIILQNTTNFTIDDLLYDQEYQGSIIANDGNGNEIEVPFTFTTDFLRLSIFELDNGANNYFIYEHNDDNVLTGLTQNFDNTHTNIQYDVNGRLSSIGNTSYSYNFNGLLTSIDNGLGTGNLNLLYDNSDKLREINITRIGNSENYVSNSKLTYVYDDLDQLILVDVERSFTSDNISGTERRFTRWVLSYTEGNLTEYTLSESQDDGITYNVRFREEITYDNKKNPWFSMLTKGLNLNSVLLFNLPIEFDPYFSVNYFFEGYRLTLSGSPHNILTRKVYFDNDLIDEYSMQYTYNDSGYPISAKHTRNSLETFPKWTYQQ